MHLNLHKFRKSYFMSESMSVNNAVTLIEFFFDVSATIFSDLGRVQVARTVQVARLAFTMSCHQGQRSCEARP